MIFNFYPKNRFEYFQESSFNTQQDWLHIFEKMLIGLDDNSYTWSYIL